MVYDKTIWIDGQTKLNAENLNKIENMIEELCKKVDELEKKVNNYEKNLV